MFRYHTQFTAAKDTFGSFVLVHRSARDEGGTCEWYIRRLEGVAEGYGFTVDVYRATRDFPREETYGLVAQLRRAAVSIGSNIAEGKGRFSDKKLLCFLSNARGSLYEAQTQIVLAERLNLLNKTGSEKLSGEAAEVGRLLNGLIRVLRGGGAQKVENAV
jgi:four helix bundle protein